MTCARSVILGRAATIVAALCCITAHASAMRPVELRGGVLLDEPVDRVSIEGVHIGGDAPRVVGWDAVKAVTGEHAAEAEPFMQIADDAWRARLRLSRGDVTLARPLFERLWPRFDDAQGPTALLVAEGTLQSRLRQAEPAAAAAAWIRALELRLIGARLAGDPPLEPVLDGSWGLVRALPPIFANTDDAETLGRAFDETSSPPALHSNAAADATADEFAAALAWWYHAAAAWETGFETPTGALLPTHGDDATDAEAEAATGAIDEPAAASRADVLARRMRAIEDLVEPADAPYELRRSLVFVRAIVASRIAQPDERERARRTLEAFAMLHHDTWVEAWARAAIGRSLTIEPDEPSRRAGVVELLGVAARFAGEQRDLAAVALAEAAYTLDLLGDDAAAGAVRAELNRIAPYHPALAWLDAGAPARRHELDLGGGP